MSLSPTGIDAGLLETGPLGQRIDELRNWRDELIGLVDEYHGWLEKQNLASGEEDLKLYELVEKLRADTLTIAMVAEFSRGKTELINAIFFADHKQRLLPSEAGRTTMCPTEIGYDAKFSPCIRLLPIESRKQSVSIAELKRTPTHWTVLPLETDSPQKMAEAFQELVKTKPIGVRDAEALGLYDPRAGNGPALTADGRVEVPVWRHAIINYPHPLLKQGVVILDTPGLNSLGTEPELTLSMLPNAHAVLFLLAADTGVTKSDLEVWNNHVCVATGARPAGRFAVLNKIDALWDELRAEGSYETSLTRQVQETVRALGIPREQIHAVSAQKGLVAKVKGDMTLLARSGLAKLERAIGEHLVGVKQKLLREKISREVGSLIEATGGMIDARRLALDNQLKEMRALSGKSHDAIQQMLTRMRDEKLAYDKTLKSFQATRQVLNDQIKILLDHLSIAAFDELANAARASMRDSWTTHGLRAGMKTLVDGVLAAMERANKQSQQIRNLVQAVYAKFHTEHGLAKIKPANFSLLAYRSQLQKLYEEAEAFRNSPTMVMTEAHFVIKKFFITLVSRVREVFNECNAMSHTWSKAVMAPIHTQVREHKQTLDQRVDNLKKVHDNLENLGSRVAELERQLADLHQQRRVIDKMLEKLSPPSRPHS